MIQFIIKTIMIAMTAMLATKTPHVQVAKNVATKPVKVAHVEAPKKSQSIKIPSKPICEVPAADLPANVDLDKIRSTWLDWENSERAANGLSPYSYNSDLMRTATIWSETSKQKGYIDHKRPGQSVYYDYKIIESWFKNLGLEFKNINSKTFTESIAWEYYSCSEADCTDKLTAAIRKGFDFFMSEKRKFYKPHYDAIVSPEFTQIGLGIIIDKSAGKYYLTVHYGTEVSAGTKTTCQN